MVKNKEKWGFNADYFIITKKLLKNSLKYDRIWSGEFETFLT